MRKSSLFNTLVGASASWCACVPQFPASMTPQQLVQYDSGAALVAYLGQSEADSSVCDLRAQKPHLSRWTAATAEQLVDGLVAGAVSPGRFQACAAAVLSSAQAPEARELLNAMGDGYRTLIERSDFEHAQEAQARLTVLQQLYLERSQEQQADAAKVDALFAELRDALDRAQLGPLASRYGRALMDAYDLEHDRWHDRAVDLSVVDALAAARDESTLRLFEARLRERRLREHARRQIVRLHIAASKHAEVRAQPEVVEARLMELGRNPVDLAAQRVEHAQLSGPVPWQSVYVHQDLRTQTAQLKGRSIDGGHWGSALPLRDRLQVKVHGVSEPVTLCAPPQALEPEPCVLASEVTTDSPLVRVDEAGVLQLSERLPLSEAVAWVHRPRALHVPLSIHGEPVLAFDWELHFQRPASLALMGQTPGAHGPAIELSVECAAPGLFLYTLRAPELRGSVVVEDADLEQFFVVSQGAPGVDGADGAPGSRGRDAGECGNGGEGGDGKSGKDGGPGADGGDVRVRVRCASDPAAPFDAARLLAILHRTVRSEAGSGGRAGGGGPGGLGGSGGTGRQASASKSGCPSGVRGRDGANGRGGRRGTPGSAGQVFFLE